MSGIVGCIGKEDTPNVLLQGLNRLEYQGYDSAGLGVLRDGTVHVEKCTGPLRQLTARVNTSDLQSRIGISGLRFATHGEPSYENSHPQTDCEQTLAVVHHGLLENHEDLKKRCLADGHKFRSKTDTEVLAHLFENRLTGSGFLEVFLDVLQDLRGSMSFLVADAARPQELFGACLEEDMWACVGKGFSLISSELAPLIAHTTEAIRIPPGSVFRLRVDGVDIYDLEGRARQAVPKKITLSLARAQRGDKDFFTLKEIHEQPLSIRRAFSQRIEERGVILRNFGLTRQEMKKLERVKVVGSGSSLHAALVARSYLHELARIPVGALPSSEQIAGDPILDERCLLMAISQSGKNEDTLQAVRDWHRGDGKVLGISNAPGSDFWKECDGKLGTYAGPEVGVVSTKTYTGSIVTSLLFALSLGRTRKAIKSVPEQEILFALQKIPAMVEGLLERQDEFRAMSRCFEQARSAFYTGYGANYATALEGALKMKQLASIHAEGMPVGELKHQVLNLVGPESPLVALALNDGGFETVRDAIRVVKDVGGTVVAITHEGRDEIAQIADACFFLPPLSGLLEPIPLAVVMQMLAAAVAQDRGIDLDKPRNLRKYYTQEKQGTP